MWENSKRIFEEGGEKAEERKMDKGKLGRMMRRGKYEVLRVKWTEEEEKFQLLPAPPSNEAPPRSPLTGGGGRLRRFVMGLIEMIRTAAASIAGRPDVIPADVIGPANNQADAAKDDNDDFDEAKCVVGAGRKYCRNCRRYHHALVPQI